MIAGTAFLWRLLSWPPTATVDAWAYAAWGQAVTRGERPLFELGATTPKPFATLLGTLAAPLPPERAFAVLVAVSAGVLAAALFAAAYRARGGVAAAVALAALAFAVPLSGYVARGYVDVVVAALVLTAVALQGYWRIGGFVAAGLLRPEAWVLAAAAGFSETRGSVARRLIAAAFAGLAAPVLWLLGDVVLIGDPLGSLHWQSDRHSEKTLGNVPWTAVPGDIWAAVTNVAGAAVLIAGMLGLGLHYVAARRRRSVDAIPLLVAVVWPALFALETHFGVKLNSRYLLPLVGVLALGCGLLAAAVIPRGLRVRSPWPIVVVAAGVVVFVIARTERGSLPERSIARNDAVLTTTPVVESVLSCGRFGATRTTADRGLVPQLAASARRSMHDFGVYQPPARFAGVLHLTQRDRVASHLPLWPRQDTPLGPLAVAPGCEAFE